MREKLTTWLAEDSHIYFVFRSHHYARNVYVYLFFRKTEEFTKNIKLNEIIHTVRERTKMKKKITEWRIIKCKKDSTH